MNYFLGDQKIRVTQVKVNPNRLSYKAGEKYVGWTARVNLKDGDSYNAAGFIRRKLQGQPKNLRRVKVQTGTPSFGIIVR
jgi:hypothetical protein